MFDLDFSKLALIGVVALVVLGPERLPRLARTAGALLGRAQRYINDVKSEVTREIEIEELRKMKAGFEAAKTGFETAATTVHNTIHDTVREHTADLTDAWNNGGLMSERVDELGKPASGSTEANANHSAATGSGWLAHQSHTGSTRRRNWRTRRSALPTWYKQANLKRTQVVSAAAREALAARQAPTQMTSQTAEATPDPAARRRIRFL